MKRRNKLRLLSWQQRRVLLYAFLLLNAIRLSLRLFSFGQIKQQIDTVSFIWHCNEKTIPVTVNFIVWSVSVAAYYTPGGAKCLARALTAQVLLNRYRYVHRMHIGVTKSTFQVLEAHAWIEYQGSAIVGGINDLNRFKTLSTAGTGQ